MTYSPYGDRDSGGTRTDVDNEVHEDHDQEDSAYDGVDRDVSGHDANGHDANGHDANGHDANGHDGAATPFQRESNEDETVGGDVVDQDGNVVEAAGGDGDERDRPDTVDAEYSEAPDAVYGEHADAPDAEAPNADASADGAVVTDEPAGTAEDVEGDLRTDEAGATDVDAPEHAEGTAERDIATEDAMAGGSRSPEDPAGIVDDRDEADRSEVDHSEADRDDVSRDDAVAMTDVDGEPVDTAYGDEADARATGTPTMAPTDETESTAADAGTDAYAGDTDRAAAADGTLDGDMENAAPTFGDATIARDDGEVDRMGADSDAAAVGPDGTAPVAGAIETDYVAVGVAEPMTEAEAADIAAAEGSGPTGSTEGVGEGVTPLDATAAADGPAVGMMPGDAPVVDAAAQPMPNADATHDRWQQIQLGFIDDPRGSVESARSLVVEAVEARISALRDRQTALDGWQGEATPDTEVLRAAIQGYRDMLNSLNAMP
jgi:hypothetical protein